ncbi:hTAFII28-like protein conserved region-domain-containing protein [Leucosporidium creatinivorum]|uniref:HTAFII28-like protein conserved region-domain-containing protein n=1 Tax=Leucosporidium creatinivorum TaxID=106004 RepID=A0A1Y2EPI2_9BASI|nr:hTAFII28-like protein conserved region-domain-containing protein [Leucosporidium creatinivorum]
MKRSFSQGSPPPTKAPRRIDSPQRGRSRSRSRSLSVAPGGGSKGKGRETDREETGAPGEEGQEGEGDAEGDAEDEELVFSDDEFGMNQKQMAKEKEDLRVLLEHFDSNQMDRYEAYRRSGLTKGNVRKLVNQLLGQSASPAVITVVRGFSKVFVGEIVEKARAVANHSGSLTPADLREAYRLYQAEHEGAGGGGIARKKMFVK